jgi:hypothetical protein
MNAPLDSILRILLNLNHENSPLLNLNREILPLYS